MKMASELEPLQVSSTDKARATFAAKLALRGIELRELSDGSYVATRWNLCRALPTLEAVAQFARAVGAV